MLQDFTLHGLTNTKHRQDVRSVQSNCEMKFTYNKPIPKILRQTKMIK